MTAAGATRLCGVSYDVSDRASVEREALRLAIENAKTTASFLADDLQLVKVEECGCYPCRMDLRGSVSGTVTFEACVQATFCRPVSEETPAA